MQCIDLNHVQPDQLQRELENHKTLVACLCADWCDVCKSFRPKYEALAAEFPNLLFLWIDIEDQASLVDHLDVDNFPTILIQQSEYVSFYGTIKADSDSLKNLINTQTTLSTDQIINKIKSDETSGRWQSEANLKQRIAEHV